MTRPPRDIQLPALTPQVGLLVAMLEDIRHVTLKGVEGISAEDLFRIPEPGEYPIGAYLLHMAEAEVFWMEVLTGDPVDDDVKDRIYSDRWFDPGEDPEPPEQPLSPDEYRLRMDEVRELLLSAVDQLSDDDLDTACTFNRGDKEYKYTARWILYHLAEHEAHHRGQIMFWKRRMGLTPKRGTN